MHSTRFPEHADIRGAWTVLLAHRRSADFSDPVPPDHRTRLADIAMRGALALMPFSAIAWTFLAR